jgi:DNA-binding SARP family transcriptional activator
MSPEDFAALARRTEGWAAGLQLFHLATQGKPARERQRVIQSLGGGSRLVRDYLARNVLAELPPELTTFLLSTCVLGRMTGPLCDKLLNASGSDALLEELERRQVFTAALDDTGVYRYHEVLRSYLEVLLVERYGEAEARVRYRRAADLLELEDMLPEALRAYVRAEDWEGATALLQTRGEEVVEGTAGWIEGLPGRLVDHDPWLQLAAARRALASGRWQAALNAYRNAESLFESMAGADACRRERRALVVWLDIGAAPPADWSGAVRQATQRDPSSVQRRALRLGPGQCGPLAAGLAALLAGNVRDALRLLSTMAEAVEAGPAAALGARIGHCIALVMAGEPVEPVELERLARMGEQIAAPSLAHLARAVLALTDAPQGTAAAERFSTYCHGNDDTWGVALATYIRGMGALRRRADAVDLLDTATTAFRSLGAGVLEAWSRAAAAVARARAGDPHARDLALQAETLARAAGARGAQALAFAALGALSDASADEYRRLAASLAEECGLDLGALTGPDVAVTSETFRAREPAPPIVLRCFGGFCLALHGVVVDCSTVKPRARAALRLLALRAPRAVHRDTLLDALWPGADPKVGARNLHVVVSSLRQLLEPGVARGASSLIIREGETYRLDLPSGADSDLVAFESALTEGREAAARGDWHRATAAFRAALDLHHGDLLPDEGSVEWIARERDEYRAQASAAAQVLAEIELAADKPEAAAAACDRGLRLDRYRDSLWRLRIRASEAAGDIAESARVRGLYREVLAELGIDAASALPG